MLSVEWMETSGYMSIVLYMNATVRDEFNLGGEFGVCSITNNVRIRLCWI